VVVEEAAEQTPGNKYLDTPYQIRYTFVNVYVIRLTYGVLIPKIKMQEERP